MWFFTRFGFYSVVRDRDDADHVLVRARVQADLDRLRTLAASETADSLPGICITPGADYAYRVRVPRAAWVRLAARLAASVDYPNFKDVVHGEPDRDEAHLAVWSAMRRLQRGRQPRSSRDEDVPR